MIHVLVVDDEKEQNQVICTYLMKKQHTRGRLYQRRTGIRCAL